MSKETTDFRYNTGATKVPWAAVGEDYNAQDLMEIVRFLMQGEGAEHDAAVAEVDAAAASCPVCEDVFDRRFTHLPIYGLSDEQLKYMADAILESVTEMQQGR